MYMKSLFCVFLSIVGVWTFSSCSDDFLGETETTNLNREAVFADSTYTAGFLTQIYVDIGYDVKSDRYKDHGGLQTSCDEAAYKANTGLATDIMFATGTVNPVAVSDDDVWKKAYWNIRRVNIFLKYVDGCRMVTSAKIEYKAEARFLRAWYYAMLLKHYGGVPLLGDDIYATVEEAQKSRDSYAACVEYIVSECNIAIDDLPTERTGKKHGRISKGVCKALISRVRLFAASKLFNGSDFAPADYPKELVGYPTFDNERWKLAVDAALDVIKMKQYDLYISNKDENNNDYPGWGFYAQLLPSDFYSKRPDVYKGTIFERKDGGGIGTNQGFAPPSTGGNGSRGYVYHDLVELFPMVDGTPTEGNEEYDPMDPAKNRDPRFKTTVAYDGCIMKSHQKDTKINIYVGTQQDAIYRGTPTGYYVRKFMHLNSSADEMVYGSCSQARPLMRYTEILLNYAEAANEYYGPAHKDMLGDQEISPYIVLRKIRECAGISAGDDDKDKYGIKDDMTYDEMVEAIRLERRLDLAFEGHRFFDVRRWMIAEQTDNKMMQGLEITQDAEGKRTWKVINTRQHTFRKAMYLYPIPYKETVKSENLLQNPYYE